MKPQWTRKFGGLCTQKIDMGKREHQLPGKMSRFILMYRIKQANQHAKVKIQSAARAAVVMPGAAVRMGKMPNTSSASHRRGKATIPYQ